MNDPIPISACLIAKALKKAPGARLKLQEELSVNKVLCGKFSVSPCECNPRCDSDIDQEDLLKLTLDLIMEVPDFAGILA